jgi:hypothetical protein
VKVIMTSEPVGPPGKGGQDGADVIPLPRDTSYEHELDDDREDPEPVLAAAIPLSAMGGDRRPIIPPHLRTLAGIRKAAWRYIDAGRHHAAYHLLRSPRYAVLAVLWAAFGVAVLERKQVAWWWVRENTQLRSVLVVANDAREWKNQHNHVRKVRQVRGFVLAAEHAAVLVVLAVAAVLGPLAWAVLAAVAVPLLAHAGRPASHPIITSAMTTPRARVISGDVILRACYVAKLGDPEKPDQQVTFGSPVTRDGDGSRASWSTCPMARRSPTSWR